MATKYVRDTAAGKSISAYVIMKGARHVATIAASFGSGGNVLVNVWNEPDAAKRCAKARKLTDETFHFQHGRAGGYGYDKFAAALAGLIIDGHEMTDHCGRSIKPPKGAELFPENFKAPRGYRLTNWKGDRQRPDQPRGYMSCYRLPGLDYLRELGYTVITAV